MSSPVASQAHLGRYSPQLVGVVRGSGASQILGLAHCNCLVKQGVVHTFCGTLISDRDPD